MNRIAAAAMFVAATVAFICQQASAQTPAAKTADLKFEVASLRPSPPGGRNGVIRPAPGGERYVANNAPLKFMLTVAFRIKADQVSGGPDWMNTAPYDLNAKAERPSTTEELHVMLQNLLVERFRLQFHRETKEQPVYVLTVDNGEPKLHPHEAQNAGDPWIDQTIEQVVSVKMKARFVPMDYFAWRLSMLLDRPVVDRTGLKGGFDFDLNYTRDLPPGIPEGAMINGSPIDTSGPTIFEALRRQLGLRLTRQTAPVETLVIDHAEKPVEN
jgi:uncharacterized protein (TIGR03435 family)